MQNGPRNSGKIQKELSNSQMKYELQVQATNRCCLCWISLSLPLSLCHKSRAYICFIYVCISNSNYSTNLTNTSWPRWPRSRPSLAHSFIHMSRRAKQKRHMQFIYCHSLDTPATPNTSGGRPRRWAEQRQLKRCRWRLIGFMPHLCVGANSWNSTHLGSSSC